MTINRDDLIRQATKCKMAFTSNPAKFLHNYNDAEIYEVLAELLQRIEWLEQSVKSENDKLQDDLRAVAKLGG